MRSVFRRFSNAHDTTIESSSLTALQHWLYASSREFEGFDGFGTSIIVYMEYPMPWREVALMAGASP